MNEKLTIKYFGVITEIAGKVTDELEVAEKFTVEELMKHLVSLYPALKLVQCKVSVNRKILTTGNVSSTDEVALLPPFSGG